MEDHGISHLSLAISCVFICTLAFMYAIENTVTNTIKAVHDGKAECNIIEYAAAFLYSDWL